MDANHSQTMAGAVPAQQALAQTNTVQPHPQTNRGQTDKLLPSGAALTVHSCIPCHLQVSHATQNPDMHVFLLSRLGDWLMGPCKSSIHANIAMAVVRKRLQLICACAE